MEIIEQYQTEVNSLAIQAKTIKVIDNQSYLTAGEFCKGLKDLRGKITEYFKPLKESAHKAHKAITQKEAGELAPIDEADKMVRQNISAYLTKQEADRKADQEKLDAEAKAAAEKEKERLLKQAVKAADKGDVEKSDELIEKAERVYIEPVFAAQTVTKTVKLDNGSVTTKKDIQVEVVDVNALLKSICDGKVPLTVVEIKINTLKSWIKSAGVKEVAGCRIKEVSGIMVR